MTRGSPLQSPRERGSPSHNWIAIQRALRRGEQLTNGVGQAARAVANTRPRGANQVAWFHPFRIYQYPAIARLVHDSTDWRKVMVHCVNPTPSVTTNYSGGNGSQHPYEYDWRGAQTRPTVIPSDPSQVTFTQVWPPGSGTIQPISTALPWHEVIVPDDGQLYYLFASTSVSPALPSGSGLILFGTSVNQCLSLYDGSTVNEISSGEVPDENGTRLLIGSVQVVSSVNGKRLKIIQYRTGLPSVGTGTGSGSTQIFLLKGVFDNYLVGDCITGGAGTGVNILKTFKLRNSAQTTVPVDGVSHTYTYSGPDAYDKWTRTDSVSGEQQIIIPRYIKQQGGYPGDEITACSIPPRSLYGKSFAWLEVTERSWARKQGT